MLARRFTIVCLMIMLFGMGLSVLVAEKSRLGTVQRGTMTACDITNPISCAIPLTR
jgi:hypothetical protein